MILVTGASGTLGKEIAKQLLQSNQEFRCLVRPTSKTDELQKLGVNLSYGDVTDRTSLVEAMGKVESVISTHSLGMQKKGITYWDVDYRGNLDLIELLKSNGGGKFVFISALGATLDSPFQLYKVKKIIEHVLTVSGLDYTVFKPSGFFTDFTMSARLVRKFHLYPAMGSGDHQIQGIAVEDLARCAIDALTNTRASHRVFSVGGPEILTFKKVAALYAQLLGHNVRTLPIPLAVQKSLAWMIDTFTSYRYEIQGFVNAFSQDSLCDNQPLLSAFPITLTLFEDYLKEYLAQNSA
jgi:uncharacterized protein YbjT (DUF2867 family)